MTSRERIAIGVALVLFGGLAAPSVFLLARQGSRPPRKAFSVITLKFILMDLGEPISCVTALETKFGHAAAARFWWDRVDQGSDEVRAIIDDLGPPPATIGSREIELFYLVHQQLEAIKLNTVEGGYSFRVNLTRPASSPNQESREISGFISHQGRVAVTKDVESTKPFGCPAA